MEALTRKALPQISDTLHYLNNTLEFCEEMQREYSLEYNCDDDNPWDNDIKGLEGAIEILTNMITRETKGE